MHLNLNNIMAGSRYYADMNRQQIIDNNQSRKILSTWRENDGISAKNGIL